MTRLPAAACLLALAAAAAATASPAPAAQAPAAPPLTAASVIANVRKANASLRSWSADFLQRRHFVHFNETETRTGTLSYARGKGLRVDVREPDAETIIVTRDAIRQWRPKTRQLHVYALDPAAAAGGGPSPIPFRFGDAGWDPEADHEVRLLRTSDPELGLEMTARDESAAYLRKVVWVDPATWLPVRVQLVEQTDDVVTFVFSDVRLDPEIDPGRFRLDAPPGADVVEHSELPTF